MRRARSGKSAPVGFIGLGLMGGPMARRLARRGVPLLVHNRNRRAAMSASCEVYVTGANVGLAAARLKVD